MRFRTVAFATALTAALGTSAGAVAPVGKTDGPIETEASNESARAYRDVVRTTPAWATPALDRIKAAGLGEVLWDRDTDTPSQLYGAGIAAPGANATAGIALAAARDFLAANLDVLAPGATVDDFVLLANTARDGFRAVGFAQHADGVRLLGAQIGFVFAHDRLVMVTSTALGNVQIAEDPQPFFSPAVLRAGAQSWIAAITGKTASASTVEDVAVLPIVHRRTANGPDIEYRRVNPVAVALVDAVGAWEVYVSSATTQPLARKNLIHYAQGTVSFDVPERHPGGTRSDYPAPLATHTVNGASVSANADGRVTWTGTASATVSPGLQSSRVRVNNASGAEVTTSLTLAPNATAVWSEADNGNADAQLAAFIHASLAKTYVLANIAPGLDWLGGRLDVYVNENDTCNAYSTGDDIHFFVAGGGCENTGRLADVVYHELGHSIHNNAVIPGVGNFDGAVSEGVSDFLAATITNDHGMGRGFFLDDSPLRDLDPAGSELVYPDDLTGEVHYDGEIIGQTLWDLRKGLMARLGNNPGRALAERIWFRILEVSVDLPSSYGAALLADDDDGNLANGTPNECAIKQAFALHGLADTTLASLGIGAVERDGLTFTIPIEAPPTAADCPPPTVVDGTLQWAVRGGGGSVASIPLQGTDTGGGAMAWTATVPPQTDGQVLLYKLTLNLSDGNQVFFPNNPADQYYELYLGPVSEIWCEDFESGATDWTHGADAGTDEWEVGAPGGLADDPDAAFAGSAVYGIDLTNNGTYRRDTDQWARTPEIDVTGYTTVRLQYQRWLGVEDGFFDNATILVDGTPKWSNLNSMQGNGSNVAHVDREWRFQDVDVSTEAADGRIQVEFRLTSDPGLQFGGWTMDRVCLVAQGAATGDVCGDGQMTGSEQCDDSNTTDGDGCSSTCTDEGEGPGDEAGGCCQTGSSGGGPLLLGLATLGLVLRRRRRRAAV
jgi:MYXO-CTERM domain-containing protein